jgi:hypothetical protein
MPSPDQVTGERRPFAARAADARDAFVVRMGDVDDVSLANLFDMEQIARRQRLGTVCCTTRGTLGRGN